jgi:hypothetical protein
MLSEAGHLPSEVRNILAPSRSSYRSDQVQSLLSMMEAVASAEGEVLDLQQELIQAVGKELQTTESSTPSW